MYTVIDFMFNVQFISSPSSDFLRFPEMCLYLCTNNLNICQIFTVFLTIVVFMKKYFKTNRLFAHKNVNRNFNWKIFFGSFSTLPQQNNICIGMYVMHFYPKPNHNSSSSWSVSHITEFSSPPLIFEILSLEACFSLSYFQIKKIVTWSLIR